MTKFIPIINLLVLGISVVTGLAGYTGIAIAGIAIYLTSKEL